MDVVSQPLARDGELDRSDSLHDRAVRVEEAREQITARVLRRTQVCRGDVLVAKDVQTSEKRGERSVVSPAACTQVGPVHDSAAARARARDLSSRPGRPDAVEHAAERRDLIAEALDPHRDLGGLARDPSAGTVPVAEPRTQHVGVDRKDVVVADQRPGVEDRVVGTLLAPQPHGVCDLGGRDDRGVDPLVPRTVVVVFGGPSGLPRRARLGEPLVLGVRDDHGSVGERDLEAGPVDHHLGRRDHSRRAPVSVVEEVAHSDVAHRGPARRRRKGCVECQRLPHGGTRRHDDHLAGVEAVGQVVEVGEARRHAVEAGLAVADRLDLVEDAAHDVAQRRVVDGRATVGDLVDLGLRVVDDVVDLALAGVAEGGDAGAGLDQAAQDRLVAHDLGVVAGVGRDRDVGRQGVEVGGATDAHQLAALLQLGGHRDRVGRLAAAVEVDDRVVDDLVGRAVVVDALDHVDDVGDRVLRQQHRAEHALLRRVVLRRRPVTRGARRAAGLVGRRSVAPGLVGVPLEGDAHRCSLHLARVH